MPTIYQGIIVHGRNGTSVPDCSYFRPGQKNLYDLLVKNGRTPNGGTILGHSWLNEPADLPEIETKAFEMIAVSAKIPV